MHRPNARLALLVLGGLLVAATFAADSAAASLDARDYTLTLGGQSFDPLIQSPTLAEGWDRSRDDRPDLHLVQLTGPTKQEMIDVLNGSGLSVVQYIHPYTYVVWGGKGQRTAAGQREFVRWSGDFAPAFRVQPQWRELDEAAREVKVLIYRGAGADDVVKSLRAMGAQETGRKTLNKTFEHATFRLPGDRLQLAANVPGVYSIKLQPTDGGLRGEKSNQINANNVDGTNLAFPGYQTWLSSVGVDGSGVVMANVDGGIDDVHPDLVNRMLPCVGSTCGGSAIDTHGTHTAGIMAADGASGTLDPFGFLRGQGVAPGANLIEQVYNPTFTQAGGMLTLIQQSHDNSSVLSGNSWGPAGSPQGYDDDTLQVDIGVRDADPTAAGNQQFSYILSFMNGNGGVSSQGSPDEAKNLFNIGSTKAQNGDLSQILAIDDLSANSAHGPALDGRTIPHMVAPGCSVDSTDTASGGYGLKCGTSMASPHVAGAVGLFFEYYRGLPDYTVDPSPALVKAAFLAVAKDLSGNLDADGGTLGNAFDSKQGWGRLDLEAVVAPDDPNGVRYFDDPQLFDNSGEEWSQTLSPLDPAKPVRIMLVWTDAPGHGLGGSTPAWNNDLDLVVEAGGNTYLGNVFDASGFSTTGGVADDKNNTEGVFLNPAPGGGLTLRVVATNINSDGVPSVGDATDQDFALACYNCALEPSFTLSTTVNSKEVCAPDSADYVVDVGQILGFADPVTLTTSGEPAGTSVSFTVNPISPPGTTTLQIDNTAAATPGQYALQVDGSAATVNRSLGLTLDLHTAIPATVSPTSPADGATGVGPMPTLEWVASAQSGSYGLEVALDPAFASVIYAASEAGTTHALATTLAPLTTYYWRVRASNSCGASSYSPARAFTTLDIPPLLVVDDDDNGPDVRATYTTALDNLGWVYDVWDTNNSDTEPDAATLQNYKSVIWFTGDEFGGAAGPSTPNEGEVISWLDDVGCLLISSQDYHYDRGLTAMMQSHLGIASATNDQSQTTATGSAVFGGLGPYTFAFPYSNYTDILVPDGVSQLAFDGDVGNLAVSKDTGIYRTSFWSFGLEALGAAVDQEAVLDAFLQWCEALDDVDGDLDGENNGSDCSPVDPAVWSAPTAARDLTIQAGTGQMNWNAPLIPGATSVSYDVIRSDLASDFSVATCVASGTAVATATDVADPAIGAAYFYLVRSRNGCGVNLGASSAGMPRGGSSCP